MKGTYLIKVSLSRGIWRKIEMAAKHTLHQLHLAINDDHLYSFFMDNKKWSYDRYESPYDEGPNADEVMIGKLGLHAGKTFLYLFNYGDEWEFKVEVNICGRIKDIRSISQVHSSRKWGHNKGIGIGRTAASELYAASAWQRSFLPRLLTSVPIKLSRRTNDSWSKG